MNRRLFLAGLGAVSVFALTSRTHAGLLDQMTAKEDKNFPFQLSDKEWRERLTPDEYRVLRAEGTERSHSSPLNDVKGSGTFLCAACDHPLFSASTKFESGTGWPSFYEPLNKNAVGTSTDRKLFVARTEVHCANCGSHLGHVFNDGPKPTGLRYCMNGIAMKYEQSEE